MAEHGTYGTAQKHYKAGERPCEPCRKALNEYARARKPQRLPALRARHQALVALSLRHPDEFRELLARARRDNGIGRPPRLDDVADRLLDSILAEPQEGP